MPYFPFWCVNNCPRPGANPCCFFSIKKSTQLFHFFNCILLTIYLFVTVWWVFVHSNQLRYTKRISIYTLENDCQRKILKDLDAVYTAAVLNNKTKPHERFGVSGFHISSVLRLRGFILTAASISGVSFLISTLLIVTTFRKSERNNQQTAVRTGILYLIFVIAGVIFSISLPLLFFIPIFSCVFTAFRIPILVSTIVFIGPYKMLEIAVTIQYLRVLRTVVLDPEIRIMSNITADEPGWLVAWWRNRKLPQDHKTKLQEEKEHHKLVHQHRMLKKLALEEEEYRKRNRAIIKRNREAERINWVERIGNFREKLPNPDVDGDDQSGIFSLDSSVTWGTNLTRSMSRSSPDSQLSVEDYMDNYEDYYDQMIKQRGGSPSEKPSVTASRPSIFTFNTMKLNKVGPGKGEQKIVASESATSIKAMTQRESSVASIKSVNQSSAISIAKVKMKSKKKKFKSLVAPVSSMSININAQNPSSLHSVIGATESQSTIKPAIKGKRKQKAVKTKDNVDPIDPNPSDSEAAEDAKRPKIIKGKQPKVMTKKKKKK